MAIDPKTGLDMDPKHWCKKCNVNKCCNCGKKAGEVYIATPSHHVCSHACANKIK